MVLCCFYLGFFVFQVFQWKFIQNVYHVIDDIIDGLFFVDPSII